MESGAEDARTPNASRLLGISEPREASGVRPIYRRFPSHLGLPRHGHKAEGLSMTRRFVLVVVLVLVLDWAVWPGCRGGRRGRTGSWSQSVRKSERRLSMKAPPGCKWVVPICMEKRKVAISRHPPQPSSQQPPVILVKNSKFIANCRAVRGGGQPSFQARHSTSVTR